MRIVPDFAIAGISGYWNKNGPCRAGMMDRIVTPGLSEAECGSLLLPAQREMGVLDQHNNYCCSTQS
jgi:hypothetical protein